MSKKCGKCEKTVYPAEELKCLDKIWHKGCFKCWECGMTLNMKNYKGFNKLPYCNAHYPQLKATVVSETPENMRIAQQSKLQSQVNYRKDGVENSHSYTQVAEDPDTHRGTQPLARVMGGGGGDSYRERVEDAPRPPPMSPPAPPAASSSGPRYRALYDYDAQDRDEVGFKEDDVIINVQEVDDGWVTGTVQSTGDRGMIPSNYIEPM